VIITYPAKARLSDCGVQHFAAGVQVPSRLTLMNEHLLAQSPA